MNQILIFDFDVLCKDYENLISPSSGYTPYEVLEAITHITAKPESIYWLPEYGCAILFQISQGLRTGFCTIHVIGVDYHKHEVHVGDKGYQFSAVPSSFVFQYVGEIKVDNRGQFQNDFKRRLVEASKRHGDERSAAGDRQGHQKTPAWIHALAMQTIKCKCTDKCQCPPVLSKGGFTDVGRHTGGKTTDFALVRSVFHHLLGDSETNQSFDILSDGSVLFICPPEVKQHNGDVSVTEDALFFMFQCCAVKGASLVDLDYNVSALIDQLEDIFSSLKKRITWKNERLRAANELKVEIRSHRPPLLKIPDAVGAQFGHVLSKDEIMKNMKSWIQ
eukprot:CAMPEP_0176476578 /NCGR_PEP_ID=MMETSP0200_2-20121128/128_1 /TAXON_ID=947934 /ORGANISM="Chaetoceros sp., Strain GSL56" /LENGTH=332 /DNA_ID=CAMNT_0017872259 /DNA_START=224 /DNA_END=1224 /DNA_ORIENTATION=-